jgi:hypothetical protein
MAHFAQINPALRVVQVVVVNNETIHNLPFPQSEPTGIAFCQALIGPATVWKQTSYNGSFRKNFAGVGYTYDAALDGFVAPKPYPSWLLDAATCQWNAPVPYPGDGKEYVWDEATISWREVPLAV